MTQQRETFTESRYVAELTTAQAAVRIARFNNDRPTDHVFRRENSYWLDLCLTPRPEQARGCYAARWGPHRYERLGEIFLMPPHEDLHIRTETGTTQASVVCEIAAEAVEQWMDGGAIEWTDRRLAAGLDIANAPIRACLTRLAEEARQPGPGSAALAGLVAGQLAIEVARYCQAIAEGPIAGGLASWRLRRIDERLQQGGPPPSLPDLAALCNMSVRQLTRGFRASRGCSIGDHVAAERIELAKRQLSGNDSIKAIAFGLGFTSPSSFSFAFRRATGASPRQFRQRRFSPPPPAA